MRVRKLTFPIGLGLVSVLMTASCGAAGNNAASENSPGSDYPTQPVTLIVPFSAGGGVDVSARKLAKNAEKHFSQPIRVVNRTGGGGTVGYGQVANADSDGYTLGIDGEAPILVRPKTEDLPYDKTDLRPITNVATWSYAFAVQADASWSSMKELVNQSRSNPKSVKVGVSGGIGQVPSINLALFSQKTGVHWSMVPMPDGDTQGIAALKGGQIDAFIGTVGNMLQYVKSDDFRVLMVFSQERNRLYPKTPIPSDLGYDSRTIPSYNFVFAPSGTPNQVVQKLNNVFTKAAKQDSFQKWVRNQGYTVRIMGPSQMQKRLDQDAKALSKGASLLNAD